MKVSFSPPDMTKLEVQGAVDAIKSGWITTGDVEILGICP